MSIYHNPVRIHFGPGSLDELSGVVGARSVILLTTRGTMERLGSRIRALVGDRIHGASDAIEPNPTVGTCTRIHQELTGVEAEAIVAIGGGSVLDTAKTVAAQRAVGRDSSWLHRRLREREPIPEAFDPPAIIAVPTTAGTGSEVTPWATVWDELEPAKHSLDHPALFPETAIVDPELTLTLSEEPTVTAALDALSHAMEAVWNRNANPISDALAERAISTIPHVLARVLDAPDDIGPREELQLASLFAGLAFSNTRTALAHSISYPLTASLGLPHGLACSFTLPEVLKLNAAADPARVELIERALGAASPDEATERIYTLFDHTGLSSHLRRYIPAHQSLGDIRGTFITPGRADNNITPIDDEGARRLLRTAYDTVCGAADTSNSTSRTQP